MPLFPPSSLNSSVNLKSATLPPVQIRNVLFSSGTSLVCPTIAPFSTLQTRASPSQPVRSLPLNSSLASFAAIELATIRDATNAQMMLRYIEVFPRYSSASQACQPLRRRCATSHRVNRRMAVCKPRRMAGHESTVDRSLPAKRIARRNAIECKQTDHIGKNLEAIQNVAPVPNGCHFDKRAEGDEKAIEPS